MFIIKRYWKKGGYRWLKYAINLSAHSSVCFKCTLDQSKIYSRSFNLSAKWRRIDSRNISDDVNNWKRRYLCHHLHSNIHLVHFFAISHINYSLFNLIQLKVENMFLIVLVRLSYFFRSQFFEPLAQNVFFQLIYDCRSLDNS